MLNPFRCRLEKIKNEIWHVLPGSTCFRDAGSARPGEVVPVDYRRYLLPSQSPVFKQGFGDGLNRFPFGRDSVLGLDFQPFDKRAGLIAAIGYA